MKVAKTNIWWQWWNIYGKQRLENRSKLDLKRRKHGDNYDGIMIWCKDDNKKGEILILIKSWKWQREEFCDKDDEILMGQNCEIFLFISHKIGDNNDYI